MSSYNIQQVTTPAVLGEGPYWDQATQMLYYVDIMSSTVYRYIPETKQLTTAKIEDDLVSLIIPIEGKKDQFVISRGRELCIMTWDGVSETPTMVEPFVSVDNDKPYNRINDGKCDASGRLWAGTMGRVIEPNSFERDQGCLFSVNAADKTVTVHLTGVSLSNGLTWSADNKIMYYIDTLTKKVEAFDFDIIQGKISNRRVIFDLEKNNIEGLPDGMTIDKAGNLWVACYSGSLILMIDPKSGKLLKRLPLPVKNITSMVFGGKHLDELFVTTCKLQVSEEDMKKVPQAGSILHITATPKLPPGLPSIPMKM